MTPENQKKADYLRQYGECKARAAELNDRLNELILDASLPSAKLQDGMPHSHDSEHDLSDFAARYDKLWTELRDEIAHEVQLVSDINTAIARMPNKREQRVLELRYISGKRWEQVAVDMDLEIRQVFRIHGSALAHFKIPRQCH